MLYFGQIDKHSFKVLTHISHEQSLTKDFM